LTDGRLLIAQVATELSGLALVESGPDANILKWKHKSNGTKVFSEYRTKGSRPVEAGETEAQAAQSQGTTIDERMPRFRPLLILPDTGTSKLPIQQRADWEAQTRRANAESYSVTIKGWLPIFNIISTLKLSSVNFQGNMLISSFALKFDQGGKKTEFNLVPPDSFAPLPQPVIKKTAKDSPLNQ